MTNLFIVGTAVLLFVGLVGGAVIYLFGDYITIPGQLPQPSPSVSQYEITTFEDCIATGNAVMESYPRQCRANGKTFVEEIGNELEKADLIRVHNPRPNQTITSPLLVTGEARGVWFFEASFPVRLLDEQGDEILLTPGYIMTEANWMTEDFVPFKATLEFNAPAGGKGTVVFQKDNPSGLSNNDDELIVPILFGESSGAVGCIVTGCSSHVCASEEIFTTCEFLPEYACYQTATCELQTNGECGWTQTPELEQCLTDSKQTNDNLLPQ